VITGGFQPPPLTLRKARWRDPTERTVRALFVVQVQPALREEAHLLEGVEDVRVEDLGAVRPIEALHKRVL